MQAEVQSTPQTSVPPVVPHVLVVDDSQVQRRILSALLTRWGYHVTEAANAEDALAHCAVTEFDIVISDWVMTGMSGLEFCKAFRALSHDKYGYFLLLTSKSEKREIAAGLDVGADDFLIKPVSPDELRSRLRAGQRIMGMHNQLSEKNRLIGSTLGELQKVYDLLDRDLIEARKVQQTMMRDRHRVFPRATATVLLRSSGHVGGDLVGCFNINLRRVALYSVDVSGHGVASAMVTAHLAGLLSGAAPEQNIALSGKGQSAWPPEMVAFRFNRMMLEGLQVDQYFTMAYAEVDLETGKVWLVQAGHPHPIIIRKGGRVDRLGQGGLPVGLIEGATYQRVEAQLHPGDRLFLMSDGVMECPDPQGTEFGEDRLAQFLAAHQHAQPQTLLDRLVDTLSAHCGCPAFPDDVSGLLFTYTG